MIPSYAAIATFDEQIRASTDSVLRFLLAEGRKDLADELRARISANDAGLVHAGSLWLTLSGHQRTVLLLLAKFRPVRRVRDKTYEIADLAESAETAFSTRLSTIRALGALGLIDWTGGVFDPEAAAMISDKGRFVALQGPDNTHWLGSGNVEP